VGLVAASLVGYARGGDGCASLKPRRGRLRFGETGVTPAKATERLRVKAARERLSARLWSVASRFTPCRAHSVRADLRDVLTSC
jgi:hypothetical protein